MITITTKGIKEKIFSNESAVLAVSLHNPNLAGDRLKYIIDWINQKENFKRCYVDLSDTLYRHNYMLTDVNISEEDALLKAKMQGDKWLDRHKVILDRLNVPFYIIRWDKWRIRPEYEEILNLYRKNYDTFESFRKCIHDDISKFFSRKGVDGYHVLPKEIRHCTNYLLEELACHTLMYEEIKAATIYPGSQPSCYKFVKEKGLVDLPNALDNMYYTRVIFHGLKKEMYSDLTFEGKKAA